MSDNDDPTISADVLAEDVNPLSANKPTGYVGRDSDVSWLRCLRHALELDEAVEHEALRDICEAKGDLGALPDAGMDMVGRFPASRSPVSG